MSLSLKWKRYPQIIQGDFPILSQRDRNSFLKSTDIIDWESPAVKTKALELAGENRSKEMIAQSCYAFVRDEIKHSLDYGLDRVTCSASEVLERSTGYCYAKSHLLAALLRANGIPAGFCYQRLSLSGYGSPYALHGLNAVYLDDYGWYRIDARGNKPGIDAQFCPPVERLAFPSLGFGEKDFREILSEPLPTVIKTLRGYATVEDVLANLPDLEAISPAKTAID